MLRGVDDLGAVVQPAARVDDALFIPTADDNVSLWRDRLFWFTLALTIFAVAPFLLPGYFWGANDARHHVYFLFEYDRLVQDGIWWPRWSPDFAFGYGYPFFNIYGPFSHFLGEVLHHFLGLSFTAAVEAVFVVSIVASAATMYAFVRSWAGRQAAVVSALVYVYVPYHLLNLYVRGNLAESMALVWLPLCLLGVRQAILRRSFAWIVAAAVSYAGLMLTSNLVIVLFTPLLGIYLLTVAWSSAGQNAGAWRSVWRRLWVWIRSAVPAVLGLVLGVGLSAIFWLPMLLERQYVRVDQWFDGRYSFEGNFVYFYQLFSPKWGFGISEAGPDDPIGFQLGAVAVILATIGVILSWRAARRLRPEIACFAAAAVVSAFVTLQIAGPLWRLPVLGTILGFAQFPWRWFSITALCLSILGGLLLSVDTNGGVKRPAIVLFALVALILLGSYPYLQIQITEPAEGPVGLAALMRFQQSSDEMTGSTAWVKEIPTWSPMADEYISKEKAGEPVTPVSSMVDYTILNYNKETGFVVNSEDRATIREEVWYWSPLEGRRIIFNQFYYPGWRAYLLDGRGGDPVQELPIIPEEEGTLGRMTVPVPVGEGYVLLEYGDTPPRIYGRWITWATLGFILLAAIVVAWRRRIIDA
ncbi:MAG: 6-pyruvoyl-tetrahydropterin synthase-related protein [Caldilineaceae bacterium]